MISIAHLERAAAPGWRAAEEERLGDWLLRAAGGFTGRANSALPVGDPGMPMAEAVEATCRWYRARGLPVKIAVSYPTGLPERSELSRILDDLGWAIRADAAWLGKYHYRGQQLPANAAQVLTSAPWQAFGSARRDGETVAIGRVAATGDWAGLTVIEVDPRHRRRGVGFTDHHGYHYCVAPHAAQPWPARRSRCHFRRTETRPAPASGQPRN